MVAPALVAATLDAREDGATLEQPAATPFPGLSLLSESVADFGSRPRVRISDTHPLSDQTVVTAPPQSRSSVGALGNQGLAKWCTEGRERSAFWTRETERGSEGGTEVLICSLPKGMVGT